MIGNQFIVQDVEDSALAITVTDLQGPRSLYRALAAFDGWFPGEDRGRAQVALALADYTGGTTTQRVANRILSSALLTVHNR